eukprot:PhF_6_TR40494/c0_g3_i3/m.60576
MFILLQILGIIIIAPSNTNTASIQQTITLPYSTQDRIIPSLFEFFRNMSNVQLLTFGNGGDFRSFVVQEQIVPPPRGPYRGSIAFGNPYVAPNPPWDITITYIGNNTNNMTMIYEEQSKTVFDITQHRASQYMVLNTTLWISGNTIGVFYIDFRVNFGESLYATSFETYVQIKTQFPRQVTIPLWSDCSTFTSVSTQMKFTEWAYMHNETYLKLFLESLSQEVADPTIVKIKERFRGWICLRYNSDVKDWVWSCGPKEGLSVSDLGFANWAIGEPRIQNSSGCVVLERDGSWTTDDCERRFNGCMTFFTVQLITSGRFIINVTSINTNETSRVRGPDASADTVLNPNHPLISPTTSSSSRITRALSAFLVIPSDFLLSSQILETVRTCPFGTDSPDRIAFRRPYLSLARALVPTDSVMATQDMLEMTLACVSISLCYAIHMVCAYGVTRMKQRKNDKTNRTKNGGAWVHSAVRVRFPQYSLRYHISLLLPMVACATALSTQNHKVGFVDVGTCFVLFCVLIVYHLLSVCCNHGTTYTSSTSIRRTSKCLSHPWFRKAGQWTPETSVTTGGVFFSSYRGDVCHTGAHAWLWVTISVGVMTTIVGSWEGGGDMTEW